MQVFTGCTVAQTLTLLARASHAPRRGYVATAYDCAFVCIWRGRAGVCPSVGMRRAAIAPTVKPSLVHPSHANEFDPCDD